MFGASTRYCRRMALQHVVRWLLPRSDDFYVFLERQAQATHAGATALGQFVPGASIDEVIVAVQSHEQAGHAALHDLEEALQQAFVTPIDRDDLQHLSSELQRVLVLIGSTARLCSLFALPSPTPPMTELMTILAHCTGQLSGMLPAMRRHDYASLMATSRTLRKEAKRAQLVSRSAISAVFHDREDAKEILREMRVIEQLGHSVDRCERVADRLANLAVKHG